MNFNAMQWFDSNIFLFIGMSVFLNTLIVYFWHKKFYQKLGFKSYRAIQRIHLNETPRLGGLVFILSLFFYVFYCPANESIEILKLILICLIPIIVLGAKEDLLHNVEPAARMLSLFFVGWLFRFQFIGPFPNMTDVPLIGKLLALQGGVSFFYILSMAVIANGMNLIDGINGLCGAVALSILGALLFLSYKTSDINMLSAVFTLILLIIPFMLFNFPFGKIFLGDLGAYSLGLIVSMLTIIFFGRHPEISPYVAVLIMIYPVTEIVFTILRRLLLGNSVFKPDILHLHLKLFYLLRPQAAYKKMANGLVMPALSILWIFPFFTATLTYQRLPYVIFAIVIFVALYLSLYFMLPNIQKYSKKNS